eukprot:9726011-Alexandrium_andersonii.AAC.1
MPMPWRGGRCNPPGMTRACQRRPARALNNAHCIRGACGGAIMRSGSHSGQCPWQRLRTHGSEQLQVALARIVMGMRHGLHHDTQLRTHPSHNADQAYVGNRSTVHTAE